MEIGIKTSAKTYTDLTFLDRVLTHKNDKLASEKIKANKPLYTAVSTDPENDTIQYVFDWDDGTSQTTTNLTASETSVNATHTWMSAGVYKVSIFAQDEHDKTSDLTEILVLIDVNVEFINDEINGYLIDYEKTGTFEVFYNNATDSEIGVEEQVDGTYLIDSNGDGEWDYSYDLTTGLTALQEDEDDEEKTPGFEFALAFLAVAIVIFCKRKRINIEF